MMFHVGQMVVCVDDKPRVRPRLSEWVIAGMVYTIRGFTEDDLGDIGIVLEEIRQPKEFGWEPGWQMDRFRPVKRTNIEIFRKLVASVSRQGDGMTRRLFARALDYAAAGVTGIAILILAPGRLLGAVAYLVMGVCKATRGRGREAPSMSEGLANYQELCRVMRLRSLIHGKASPRLFEPVPLLLLMIAGRAG